VASVIKRPRLARSLYFLAGVLYLGRNLNVFDSKLLWFAQVDSEKLVHSESQKLARKFVYLGMKNAHKVLYFLNNFPGSVMDFAPCWAVAKGL